jgi:hypothetical protein
VRTSGAGSGLHYPKPGASTYPSLASNGYGGGPSASPASQPGRFSPQPPLSASPPENMSSLTQFTLKVKEEYRLDPGLLSHILIACLAGGSFSVRCVAWVAMRTLILCHKVRMLLSHAVASAACATGMHTCFSFVVHVRSRVGVAERTETLGVLLQPCSRRA